MTEFSVVNAHKDHRLPWVAKFLKQPPFHLKQGKTLLRRYFPLQVARAAAPIRRINTRYTARPEVSDEIKKEMAREFADDIELLGSMLNRDLSHWYKNAL
jgi:hypothetical protein